MDSNPTSSQEPSPSTSNLYQSYRQETITRELATWNSFSEVDVLEPVDEEEEDAMEYLAQEFDIETSEAEGMMARLGGEDWDGTARNEVSTDFSGDVFEEDYGGDEEEEEEEEDEEVNDNPEDDDGGDKLGITEARAKENYRKAGSLMPEEPEKIMLEDFKQHMNPEAEEALDELEKELNLPYEPLPYQRIAISCAANGENVVLVVPCGSGKTDVILKGSRVLRKTSGDFKGVTIVTQPLTALMKEKMDNPIAGVAVLSMAEELTVMGESEEGERSLLSCPLEDMVDGKYPVLIGHPESFATPLGKQILRELQRLNRIQSIIIDEFHQGGDGHWISFRPDMLRESCGLRVYARKGASVTVMTATATEVEIKKVVEMLGLRKPPVVMTCSPVQSFHKYSVIKRPSNSYGLMGTVTKKGVKRPGLFKILDRLYLGQFLKDLKAGKKSKRCIIFFRSNLLMGAVYALLKKLTGFTDPKTAPFVMNHSSLLPPDDKMLSERRDEITLFLASNKMLLGQDPKKIDIVIFTRPFNQPAACIQGGGRGARRDGSGYRGAVQVYQLYNSSDLTKKNKEMSESMRRLCTESTTSCTKVLLREVFAGDSSKVGVLRSTEELELEHLHCCNFHDMMLVK